eukprot:maker-scaffold1762_size28832-snap-gene-0.4 protein:Tk09884 transcript:maker-scaffold1762_size28832-snap-gene-0.4-mRNA-1 annotation:"hypothetical protein NECAME_18540"
MVRLWNSALANETTKNDLTIERIDQLVSNLNQGFCCARNAPVLFTEEKLFTIQAVHNPQNDRILGKRIEDIEKRAVFRTMKTASVMINSLKSSWQKAWDEITAEVVSAACAQFPDRLRRHPSSAASAQITILKSEFGTESDTGCTKDFLLISGIGDGATDGAETQGASGFRSVRYCGTLSEDQNIEGSFFRNF